MKIIVKHRKPGAYDLFYPVDEKASLLITACNPARPYKSFTIEQLRKFKQFGVDIQIEKSEQEIPEL